MKIKSNLFKDGMPFSALGIAFVLIGLTLKDGRQLAFGFVWFLVVAIAVFVRKKRK